MTHHSISANGQILDLGTPRIMGVLNVTPDSFYDGGRYTNEETILRRVAEMLEAGADIIDIGGMSSRPGAALIPLEEEKKRVFPFLEAIRRAFPDIWISIDTVRSEIASGAASRGANMINDISAGSIDPDMFRTVSRLGIPYVLMHMQGLPNTMQKDPVYDDVVREVLQFLLHRLRQLRDLGVRDVILDPGFGFGKTVSHNYQILKHLEVFQIAEAPILVGMSRKSLICKVLGINPENALNGTTALHMVALQNGAHILRVHDVREAKEVVRLFTQLENPLKPS